MDVSTLYHRTIEHWADRLNAVRDDQWDDPTPCRDWTVRDFVFAVAKLGGFLGRKRDGLPGVRSLWRGYQRLQDMVAGYRLRRLSQYKTSA